MAGSALYLIEWSETIYTAITYNYSLLLLQVGNHSFLLMLSFLRLVLGLITAETHSLSLYLWVQFGGSRLSPTPWCCLEGFIRC
jgi:hypothetical protein